MQRRFEASAEDGRRRKGSGCTYPEGGVAHREVGDADVVGAEQVQAARPLEAVAVRGRAGAVEAGVARRVQAVAVRRPVRKIVAEVIARHDISNPDPAMIVRLTCRRRNRGPWSGLQHKRAIDQI
mgnify:CR=1 FL=1